MSRNLMNENLFIRCGFGTESVWNRNEKPSDGVKYNLIRVVVTSPQPSPKERECDPDAIRVIRI